VKDLFCGLRAQRMDGCTSTGGAPHALSIVPWRPQTTACSPSATAICCEVSRPIHARRRLVVPK
jgi:hypothetical protein